MKLLSDDDLDLGELSDEELARAWDLWFDVAQTTNDDDPPYSHGVFSHLTWEDLLRYEDTGADDRTDISAAREGASPSPTKR